MTLARCAVVALSFGSVLAPDAPASPQVKVTGLFSNLEYNNEGGDLLGLEVYLVTGAKGRVAVVQCAGGAPSDPIVVPVSVTGDRIGFNLPAGQPECGTAFEGVVSSAGMRGRFRGESDDRWLPRRKGYWQ